MRWLAALPLCACTFLGPPEDDHFDRDGDGVLGNEDCHDENPDITHLVPDASLVCGDAYDDGFDPVGENAKRHIFNCEHETDPDHLISLKGSGRVYLFRNPDPTDVHVWIEGVHPDSKDHYILANQGLWCTVDTCVMGRRSSDSVDFYAQSNEGWFLLVSQGTENWDTFTVNVACATP